MQSSGCMHRLVGIDAVVIRRVQEGYVAHCLLCDKLGAVRSNPHTAREVLSVQQVPNESKTRQ